MSKAGRGVGVESRGGRGGWMVDLHGGGACGDACHRDQTGHLALLPPNPPCPTSPTTRSGGCVSSAAQLTADPAADPDAGGDEPAAAGPRARADAGQGEGAPHPRAHHARARHRAGRRGADVPRRGQDVSATVRRRVESGAVNGGGGGQGRRRCRSAASAGSMRFQRCAYPDEGDRSRGVQRGGSAWGGGERCLERRRRIAVLEPERMRHARRLRRRLRIERRHAMTPVAMNSGRVRQRGSPVGATHKRALRSMDPPCSASAAPWHDWAHLHSMPSPAL